MTKRSNTGKGTFGSDLQCVAPDHTNGLGIAGIGDVIVPSGSAVQTLTAPADGTVIVGLPSGLAVRVRIGDAVTALATDALYVGPMAWHFPIVEGHLVSLLGDGGGGTATVCMAK